MVRRLLLVSIWFPLTITLLVINLIILESTIHSRNIIQAYYTTSPLADNTIQVAASFGTGRILGTNVIAADSRALLLESFLTQYHSPLAPYADLIVRHADENGIDFRLTVAIAMCESNLGKHMPTQDSYNAWGIAVYTGQQSGAAFEDWPHAIEWVSRYIKEHYYNKGIIDLKDIGAIWAPPSVEKGYSWTNCVDSFQKSIL
jgi:hypothetical protein